MVAGASVKVERMTGKYADFAFRPRREGQIIEVDGDKALVRFPCKRRDMAYYYHDHWFYTQDLREIHHRKVIKRIPRRKQNG